VSHTKQCVTILGGGIRGTAIAALLAQSRYCKVILLESDNIASSTTSTNQGRLHSGAHLLNSAALRRVIVILEKDRSPTAIPHHPWITFGCRLTPEVVSSPSDAHEGWWQHFNRHDEMDNILFEEHARYFLPLQSLNSQDMSSRLFSFSGIYPAFERHRETPFRLLQSDKVPHYYVVYGENATTALLDALDTIQVVLDKLDPSPSCLSDYVMQLARQLCVDLTQSTYPGTARMIWQNMIADHLKVQYKRPCIEEQT
jgi:hypothetical protein